MDGDKEVVTIVWAFVNRKMQGAFWKRTHLSQELPWYRDVENSSKKGRTEMRSWTCKDVESI